MVVNDATGKPRAMVGVTPDGSEVWVGSNDLGIVSVIDTGSGEVTQALEGFGWPYRVVFSEDGETVLLPDLRGNELRIVDVDSRQERARVSFPDAGPQSVVFSADGRYAFQSLSQQDRVAVIDLESGAVIGYLPAGYRPDGLYRCRGEKFQWIITADRAYEAGGALRSRRLPGAGAECAPRSRRRRAARGSGGA